MRSMLKPHSVSEFVFFNKLTLLQLSQSRGGGHWSRDPNASVESSAVGRSPAPDRVATPGPDRGNFRVQ